MIHSFCVCARVRKCQSHFSPVSCVRFALKGGKTKKQRLLSKYWAFARNSISIHCIKVRHIKTEQNQEKTRCGMISYMWEPCLFDTEQFTDHFPVKNEVCPEVEMKDVYKCNLTLQLESVDDLTSVTGLQDGKQCGWLETETRRYRRYVWSQPRVYWSWLATMLPDIERLLMHNVFSLSYKRSCMG